MFPLLVLFLGFPCTLFTFIGWHLSWYNSLTTRQWIVRERGPVSFSSFTLSSLLFLTTVLPPIFPCILWLGRFMKTPQIYVLCVGWCLSLFETNLLETVYVTFLPIWKISGRRTMHSKSVSMSTILDRCLEVHEGQIGLSVSPTCSQVQSKLSLAPMEWQWWVRGNRVPRERTQKLRLVLFTSHHVAISRPYGQTTQKMQAWYLSSISHRSKLTSAIRTKTKYQKEHP